jgi:hypothetical protein
MKQQHKRAPVERPVETAAETTELSDLGLLAAIRQELLWVYAELLHESVPERVAQLVRRLDAETKQTD